MTREKELEDTMPEIRPEDMTTGTKPGDMTKEKETGDMTKEKKPEDMTTERDPGAMGKEETGLLPEMLEVEVALIPKTDTGVLPELEDLLPIIIEIIEIGNTSVDSTIINKKRSTIWGNIPNSK